MKRYVVYCTLLSGASIHTLICTLLDLQEKVLKEQLRLEQNVALFEQRKIASKEELQYAEDRIVASQQMNAKVQAEMDKLLELSEFVTRKDKEANQKLVEASALYAKAQELEAVCLSQAEAIEQQKEQIERERELLVQERVLVLKERSFNRDMGRCERSTCIDAFRASKDNNLSAETDLMLRNRLAAIKSQLKKLKE